MEDYKYYVPYMSTENYQIFPQSIQYLDLPKQHFFTLNSSSLIHNIQKNNKKLVKQRQTQKKYLTTQIKNTNNKIKLRKFCKFVNLDKVVRGQEKIMNGDGSKNQKINQQKKQEKLKIVKTFDQFLANKKIDNKYLKEKMKVFSSALTQRQKGHIQREISNYINNNNLKRAISCTSTPKQSTKSITNSNTYQLIKPQQSRQKSKTDQIINNNLKTYEICHRVLQKLLSLMVENPTYISLKNQQPELYKNIKQEMIQILLNNDNTATLIKNLSSTQITKIQQQQKQNRDEMFNWANIKQIKMKRKPFYKVDKQIKDQSVQKINTILVILSEMIETAFRNFTMCQKYQQMHCKQKQVVPPILEIHKKISTKYLKSTMLSSIKKTGCRY